MAVPECVGVGSRVGVGGLVSENVAVRVSAGVMLWVGEKLNTCVAVEEKDSGGVTVAVRERLRLCDRDADALSDNEDDALRLALWDSDVDALVDNDEEGLRLRLRESDAEGLPESDLERLWDAVYEALRVAAGVTVAVAVWLADGDAVPDWDEVCVRVFENVAERVGAGVTVAVMLSLGDAECEIECVSENVALGVGAGVIVNVRDRLNDMD